MAQKPGKAEIRSRYGNRTHDLFYSSLNKLWYIGCKGVGSGNQFASQWVRVDDSFPVTCKRCQKRQYP